MADGDNRLPEGTDTVIDDGSTAFAERDERQAGNAVAEQTGGTSSGSGASSAGGQGSGGGAGAEGGKFSFDTLKQNVFDQTAELRGQAGERARDLAGQGKDKATEALDHVAQLVNDAAAQVEEKLGPDYAAYARRAAEAVTGAADGLRSKDIEALLEDAKGYVRATPAVAIGVAAALGFVFARLAKSGLPGEVIDPAAPDTHPERN